MRAGFYNINVPARADGRDVLVRIPIVDAEEMDLRVWREEETLQRIAPYVPLAPRLLYQCENPRFQIQEFIPGEIVDVTHPQGTVIPGEAIRDLIRFMSSLLDIPRRAVPGLSPTWPDDGDTPAFGRLLSEVTARAFTRGRRTCARAFRELGIPSDPLAPVIDRWRELAPRVFGFVHADIHRKNMINSPAGVRVVDWELALWGDPVYEMAVHLHKMGYPTEQERRVTDVWADSLPASLIDGHARDIAIYRAHEQVKSAVVDTVRYVDLFRRSAFSHRQPNSLIDSLTAKLAAAHAVWETPGSIPDREHVRQVLESSHSGTG